MVGFEAEADEDGETVAEGEGSPFFVGSSGGCDFEAVVASVVSVVDAVLTIVAVAGAFPSIFGFDDAAPPFPPFPFAPFGGDDLRDEDEFAVKYLCLFPFPSPPPPDLEEKNEKVRTCCAACTVVDVEIAAAVEGSETVGRAATSRANICKTIMGVRKKVWTTGSHPLALVSRRGMSHAVTAVTRCPRRGPVTSRLTEHMHTIW